MKTRKLLVFLMVLAMLATLIAGCGGADKKPAEKPATPAKPAGPSGKLMIYTSMFPDIIEAVKPELKKAFPNLDVQWFQAGSEQVMTKLAGEIEAKKVAADVLLVNTCAIRENAEERVLGRLSDLLRHKMERPGVRLGLLGCVATHQRDRLLDRAPYLDVIVGPDGYRDLPELLRRKIQSAKNTGGFFRAETTPHGVA